MNNSSVIPEESIQEISDDMAQLLLPSTVFHGILMVSGLLGNLMVCYYYGFKEKKNPTNVFILALAAYDLITCTVTMPYEIVLNFQYFTYSNNYACKSVTFITHFGIFASALTLPAIAVDRYKHICVVAVYRTTVKNAMKQCAVVATLAIFFSWPAIIFYVTEVTPVPTENGPDLNGSTCGHTKELSSYELVFDVVHLTVFFICITILIALYFRICRVLFIHRRNFGKFETTPSTVSHSKRIDQMTAKITIGMVVIAIVFCLSFIPRLSLTTWSSIGGAQEFHFLSGASLSGFHLGLQSYLLNSSLNPWIYGIFNTKFRQFYYRALCTQCRPSGDTTATAERNN